MILLAISTVPVSIQTSVTFEQVLPLLVINKEHCCEDGLENWPRTVCILQYFNLRTFLFFYTIVLFYVVIDAIIESLASSHNEAHLPPITPAMQPGAYECRPLSDLEQPSTSR